MFASSETALKTDKWQRLSPSAILFYIVKFVTTLVKQGLQGLAPIAAIAFTAGENRWLIIGLIAIGIVILLLGAAFLSYLKFRYRINKVSFLIQSGVFTRKRLSLGFDRIQNVAIKEPIYFRPFGTVVLSIESAGSSAAEVSLAGIPRPLAEAIRATVLANKQAQTQDIKADHSDEEPPADEVKLLHQPVSELARYGLTNNNIWVFAGILAGATAQFDWWEYLPVFNMSDITTNYSAGNFWLIILAGIASFAGFITVMMGISAIGAIIVYYNYHLFRHKDGRFHRTKGLFEKQETSLPETKIQSLTIKQPWPALLLSRYNLVLNQVGFHGTSADGSKTASPSFVVPSVTASFLDMLSKHLYPSFRWQGQDLKGISHRYSIKTAFYEMLPISLIPTTVLTHQFGLIGLLPLAIPFAAFPIIERYRRMYGYVSDGEHGLIQTGLIGTRRTILPFHKVQTVELVRSPGQRKHSLASLYIKMAGSKHTIPYMPLEDALIWRDAILRHIESNGKAWM